ncbi:MAG TPA: DUF1501 domain-containing protein [Rhizomicrobium sp.]|nr:DUF1501 domain-containing protein [Rhizomicrobium sp.]
MSYGPVTRRLFARYMAGLAAATGTAAPFALQLAAMNAASAQGASGYKALVCIFLFGGNDGHNTVLATDADTFGRYFAARNIGADPIALMPVGTSSAAIGSISQFNGRTVTRTTPEFWGGVLPIVPSTPQTVPSGTNATSRTFALHPMLQPLIPLFQTGRLAILANVGTLIQPTTKAQYVAGSVPLPSKLFSHNDQQSEWQSGQPEGARFGYGGQIADLVLSQNSSPIYTAISTAGNVVYLSGHSAIEYQITTNNPPAIVISGMSGSLFGSSAAANDFKAIIQDNTSSNSYFAVDYAAVTTRSINAASMINTAYSSSIATAVPAIPTYTNPATNAVQTNTLALQLQTVAKIIAANSALGATRQIFFVSLGGFDTHQFENTTQPNLLAQVAQAISYFDGALSNIGGVDMRPMVTTFTASDFNRTFTSNGSGTDHAWGSHHFIHGGAVKAGTIYGQYPTLGVDSGSFQNPNMSGNALIPTVSVDQYGATLGAWFGVSASNLVAIFTNLPNFSVQNLGFV